MDNIYCVNCCYDSMTPTVATSNLGYLSYQICLEVNYGRYMDC